MRYKCRYMGVNIAALLGTFVLASPAFSIEKQFKAQHSNLCLSTATDTAQVGANVVQSACDTTRSKWDVIPVKGDQYRIVSKANGLCLAVANDSVDNTNIVQQSCNDVIDSRLWRFNLVSLIADSFYELKNGASFRCIDVASGSSAIDAPLVQWDCLRGPNQHWNIAGAVPDTAEKIDLKLLIINKPVSLIPGHEYTMPDVMRTKLRTLAEVTMPKFVHDYTNGRVKLNTYFYESPLPLTSMQLNGAGQPEFITTIDVPEDMDNIANPGWYDGIEFFHGTPNAGGFVSFTSADGEFDIATANVHVDENDPTYLNDKLEAVAGGLHEWLHGVDGYYYQKIPARSLSTEGCSPFHHAMLDCADYFGYPPTTDGFQNYLAFIRDYLNGYIDYGKGALGQPMWALGTTPRDRNAPFVPGGPLDSFVNKSTCLNLTSPSGIIAKDLNSNNNFAWVRNKNLSSNWTGSGFLFDGVDDYLRMANLVGDDFTISAWIKSSQVFPAQNSISTGVGLVYAGAAGGDGFELRGIRNSNGADVIRFTAGNFSAVLSNTDITNNAWVHVGVVRNQKTGIVSLYINGILQATGMAGAQRLNKNPIVKIGSAIHDNDYFNGEMADFCLLNTALDATAIANLAKSRTVVDKPGTSATQVYLSDMAIQSSTTGAGEVGINKNFQGTSLTIGGKTYAKGLGTHAPSKIVYKLDGKASWFLSDIGVDDVAFAHFSSAQFLVYGDGNLLYNSNDKFDTDLPESIEVDIRGVKELTLVTNRGKTNGNNADYTDWGNARLDYSTAETRLHVEAENFSSMIGVQTEATTDVGGGLNVGYIDANDLMTYANASINVPITGNYTVTYRVASAIGGGNLVLEEADGSKSYDTTAIANTGGWQTWTSVKKTILLTAGTHRFRLRAATGGFNVNWFEIDVAAGVGSSSSRSSSSYSSSSSPVSLATIQAEAYSTMNGIQTETTTDVGGGLNVGWTDVNDWMSYANSSVTIPSAGTYTIEYRVASLNGGGSLRIEEAGSGTVYGTVSIPSTGGWQTWTTIKHTVNLSAGAHKFTIRVAAAGWNLNWFRITPGTI